MTTQSINPHKKDKERDPDMAGIEPALKRAALRARERARQTGTKIIIMRGNKIVEEDP